MQQIWDIIQNQILGMKWLNELLGTVTPFCSCSSIPLFIGFTGAGLPLGVTFSFLISSPMVDLGSLVLLMSIFGWKVAVLYVAFGLVIAVLGGTLIEKLRLENQVEDFIRSAKSPDIEPEKLRFKDRIRYAWEQVLFTAKKVLPYVLIGVGIGALIHNWIPEEWIVKALGGNNPFGVIFAAIAGIPMYADIFGTIPIAEALLAKGALLGVVLSFMMGVTTLSLPSVIMLRKAVKPKLLGIFISICILGIILVGYLFNLIQPLIIISGCASCRRQYEYAKEAVKNMGIPVEVEYITDIAKVMEYGVMSMPALVVNEKVAAMGKVLKPSEIEKLLRKLGF